MAVRFADLVNSNEMHKANTYTRYTFRGGANVPAIHTLTTDLLRAFRVLPSSELSIGRS